MASFTEKAIRESFIKLLNEKPLNQITIKDIVEDCGINRNSFYYHFADLPTLLEEIITEKIYTLIQEYPSIQSFEDCFEVIISACIKDKRALCHIYNSVNRDILEKYLMRICEYAVSTYFDTIFKDVAVKKEDKEILTNFYKCLCFGQCIEWMNTGMNDGIIDKCHRFCQLSHGMMEEMVKRSIEE